MSTNRSIETPPYHVIARRNGYEIRRYNNFFLAQHTCRVPARTDWQSKSSIGFFPLFQYISGNNNKQARIAMTTPVIIQEKEGNGGLERKMSFIMSPSTFTSLNQVPRTYDPNIQIIEQSNARDMACITFNMFMSTEINAAKERELREAAAQDGIQLSTSRNDVLYFGYDPPDTSPYLRRNEICIPIINQR